MQAFKTIERSPVPLYTQVREALRERILDGTYAPRAQLPPEGALGTMFGVSRITVRQALNDLQKEGVIFKVAGKGTFVATAKVSQELSQLEGFAEAMAREGHRIINEVLSHVTGPAGPGVAAVFGLSGGAPEDHVTEIKRIRYLNNAPVSLEITYLPRHIGERLRNEDLTHRDIFLILENDYGIELGSADVQIGAVSADKTLATALQVATGTALLRIERLTRTADGLPLDFEYLYFRCDAFQYRLQVARHPARPHTARSTPRKK
jgi:GntR family transcriptional regulator